MARKHKGKYALMHGMGLCKYRTGDLLVPLVVGEQYNIKSDLDLSPEAQKKIGEAYAENFAKRSEKVWGKDGVADSLVGIAKGELDLMQNAFIGQAVTAGFQGFMQIWGAALSHHVMLKQMDLQDRAMALQENVANHKMQLETLVVESTTKLADKKMKHDEELARIGKSRDVAISEIQSDAKVAIAGKKALASAFRPNYFYGGPVAVG